MRLIAHLSDLHFGREDPRAVAALLADLEALRADYRRIVTAQLAPVC